MILAALLAAMCSGAGSASAGSLPDGTEMAKFAALKDFLVLMVHRDKTPRVVGEFDVYIDDADLIGPFRLSVLPAFPNRPSTVEIADMHRPAAEVASEQLRAGVAYGDVDPYRFFQRYTVDVATCPTLQGAVDALEQAFLLNVRQFAATPHGETMASGAVDTHLVEFRMVGPDFQGHSIVAIHRGPTGLLQQANRVAEVAAGCARRSVRNLVDNQ